MSDERPAGSDLEPSANRDDWLPPPSEEWQKAHGWRNGKPSIRPDGPDAAELEAISQSGSQMPNVAPTEDAVASAFAEAYAGRMVYDHTEEYWFLWEGGRWARDPRRRVFHAARQFTRSVRTGLAKPPASITKIAFATAVDRAARADPKIAVSHEVWDTNQWLLGTPGGVVDLRTGELLSATPELYISRHTTVTPAPVGTTAPRWQAFLDSATQQDTELQRFLQRLCGYVLTGDASEEVLTFFYGPGGNGKGTLLTALIGILGGYAVSLPIETFTVGSRINLEYYRAQMAGARLVTASETEAQATWAEAQIKEITGNDTPLSGRHPYGKPFTFRMQAKVIIVGNYAPKLKGRSPAMERRLRVVPFTHMPQPPDPELKEKLRAEYPAILRWMIEGCLIWQGQHLGTANAIRAATSAYFEQQDAFRRWLDERCLLDKTLSLTPGVLLADFNEWARENGEETVANNAFAEMIDRAPGLVRIKSNGVRMVRGLGLRTLGRPNYRGTDL